MRHVTHARVLARPRWRSPAPRFRTGSVTPNPSDARRRYLPVHQDWRLNERMYGGLQGLDKKETVEKHGQEQVNIWRRSYATPPPLMEPGHQFDPHKVSKRMGLKSV